MSINLTFRGSPVERAWVWVGGWGQQAKGSSCSSTIWLYVNLGQFALLPHTNHLANKKLLLYIA